MCAVVDDVGVFHTDQIPSDFPREHYLRNFAAAAIPMELQQAIRSDDSCLRNACIRGQKTPTYKLLQFDTKLEEIRNAARKLVDVDSNYVMVNTPPRVEVPAFQDPAVTPTESWTEVESDQAEPVTPTATHLP